MFSHHFQPDIALVSHRFRIDIASKRIGSHWCQIDSNRFHIVIGLCHLDCAPSVHRFASISYRLLSLCVLRSWDCVVDFKCHFYLQVSLVFVFFAGLIRVVVVVVVAIAVVVVVVVVVVIVVVIVAVVVVLVVVVV